MLSQRFSHLFKIDEFSEHLFWALQNLKGGESQRKFFPSLLLEHHPTLISSKPNKLPKQTEKAQDRQHTSPCEPCHLPYDAEELGHGQLLGDQELSLVQRGQELLPGIALHYHLSRGSALKNVTQNSQYLRILQQGERMGFLFFFLLLLFFFHATE